MEVLRSTKSKITKEKNGENEPHLEITEVVLLYCNIRNNDYQQDSKVLYKFVPNKSFGQYIEIWFTDQSSRPLEIEDIRNINLVID